VDGNVKLQRDGGERRAGRDADVAAHLTRSVIVL